MGVYLNSKAPYGLFAEEALKGLERATGICVLRVRAVSGRR